jgi:hypothetical protein
VSEKGEARVVLEVAKEYELEEGSSGFLFSETRASVFQPCQVITAQEIELFFNSYTALYINACSQSR